MTASIVRKCPLRKLCNSCHQLKPETEFYVQVRRNRPNPTLHSRCKKCFNAAITARNRTATGRKKLRARRAKPETRLQLLDALLRCRHGLTIEQYNALLRRQRGRCAICGAAKCKTKRRLSVDHDHATDLVRGLLCNNCNIGIGQFQDNPVLLRKAAAYLERHQKNRSLQSGIRVGDK